MRFFKFENYCVLIFLVNLWYKDIYIKCLCNVMFISEYTMNFNETIVDVLLNKHTKKYSMIWIPIVFAYVSMKNLRQ